MSRLLYFTISSFLFFSCKNDKQAASPGPTCPDTTNITYSAVVTPILAGNCYSCHGTNSNAGSGGIILQDYSVIKTYAIATSLDGSTGSKLYGNITHAGSPYVNMPFGGGQLSDCDIKKIKIWINAGAPNN